MIELYVVLVCKLYILNNRFKIYNYSINIYSLCIVIEKANYL